MADFYSAEDLAAMRPEDYLKSGFHDASGKLRRELRGIFAIAMAQKLGKDGAGPLDLRPVVDFLSRTAGPGARGGISAFDRPRLDAAVQEAGGPASVRRFVRACLGQVKTWDDVRALATHLGRVMQQLALRGAVREADEVEKIVQKP